MSEWEYDLVMGRDVGYTGEGWKVIGRIDKFDCLVLVSRGVV